jgi:hypothetical protein
MGDDSSLGAGRLFFDCSFKPKVPTVRQEATLPLTLELLASYETSVVQLQGWLSEISTGSTTQRWVRRLRWRQSRHRSSRCCRCRVHSRHRWPYICIKSDTSEGGSTICCRRVTLSTPCHHPCWHEDSRIFLFGCLTKIELKQVFPSFFCHVEWRKLALNWRTFANSIFLKKYASGGESWGSWQLVMSLLSPYKLLFLTYITHHVNDVPDWLWHWQWDNQQAFCLPEDDNRVHLSK